MVRKRTKTSTVDLSAKCQKRTSRNRPFELKEAFKLERNPGSLPGFLFQISEELSVELEDDRRSDGLNDRLEGYAVFASDRDGLSIVTRVAILVTPEPALAEQIESRFGATADEPAIAREAL